MFQMPLAPPSSGQLTTSAPLGSTTPATASTSLGANGGGELAYKDGVVPWVEKYRPDNLEKIHGHEEILSTIRRFLKTNQLPNLLFHGPAGTGKTTTAVAICKQIFGKDEYKLSTLELNASDDRGINVIRNEVKNFSQTTSFGSFTFSGQDPEHASIRRQFKVVVLDEADSMINTAQFALRRMIEQYANSVRFIIICNFAHKIIPALVSRCTSFRFSVLPEEHTVACVRKVAEHEKIKCDELAIQALQKCSKGDLRKVLNMLQSLVILERAKQSTSTTTANSCTGSDNKSRPVASPVKITEDEIYRSLGLCTPSEVDHVVRQLLTYTGDPDDLVRSLCSQKGNLQSLLPELHARFAKLTFQNLEQRKQVMDALAKVEHRFCLGSFKTEFEAAYLVNEIMMLRAKWKHQAAMGA
ncbi:unnamed protein product [Amoebophrya sp. A25]|nr:unnamed protein product [Amoebophrya sp. A25]|eukprot:GSA25T00006928001.1